jgi:hypothetical protein
MPYSSASYWRRGWVICLTPAKEPSKQQPDSPGDGDDREQDYEKDGWREEDSSSADRDSIVCVERAAKDDKVVGDGGESAQPHVAAKDDHISTGVLVQLNVAKENNDIASHLALGFNRTEETNDVVGGLIFGEDDRISKMDDVSLGCGGQCDGSKQNADCQ